LICGLRYTNESKDHIFGRRQLIPTFWTTIVNPPFAATALPFDDEFLNGNGAIQFDVTDDVMLYASYGVGTKTGGFAESAAVPTGNPLTEAFVGSETAKALELGFKSTLFDGRARFNGAFFYTEVDDFQETSFSGASFDTINSQVKVAGAEASLFWKVSDSITIDTAWTYADAKIDAGTFLIGGAPTAFPSRSPAQSPKWTGHAGIIGELPISDDWELNGSAYFRHRSSMIHQFVETFRSDALSTFDLTVGISNPTNGWAFSVIGTNLTNEISADFSGPPASAGIVPPNIRVDSPGRLRTILLQVRKDF
jgi:iron complex outermembrane receptor protein